MTNERKAILILGMHRSGTSALSGALSLLGVDFGQQLLEPSSANEKGFFENKRVYRLHEALLDALESSWDDEDSLAPDWAQSEVAAPFADGLRKLLAAEFGESALPGVKDPRLARLLPLWLPVLEEAGLAPHFVLISRHPREVAESLRVRDGFPREKSYRLWLRHVFAAEAETRDYPRAFVTYEELLANPAEVLARIGEELQVEWPHSIEESRGRLDDFLSEQLRHHRAGTDDSQSQAETPALLEKVYECLTPKGADGPNLKKLRQLHAQMREVEDLFSDELRRAKERLAQVGADADRTAESFDNALGIISFQVYLPANGGYTEERSTRAYFSAGVWKELSVSLRGLGDGSLPLRLDPTGLPGVIEIADLRICSAIDGHVLWRAPEDFHDVKIGGTAQRLPGHEHLRILSFGVDPQTFLPVPHRLGKGTPLELRVRIRVATASEDILRVLGPLVEEREALAAAAAESAAALEKTRAAGEERIRVLETRSAAQRAEMDSLETRCAALAAEARAAAGLEEQVPLLEQAREEAQRRAETAEWELARARLLLENTQTEARSSSQQLSKARHELAGTQSKLEEAEREASENKVWRADLTARLKESERVRKSIEGSAIWRAVKPIWKLSGRAERQRARATTKAPRKVSSAIDAPAQWSSAHESLMVRGWCFNQDGREILGIRAKLGSRSFLARYPIERADVAGAVGFLPGALQSGFAIELRLPPGSSVLRLESISPGGNWETFFEQEVTRTSDSSAHSRNGAESTAAKNALGETQGLPDCRRMSAAAILQKISSLVSQDSTPRADLPRISILTPTHNTRIAWLGEAALSLLGQTFTDWEWCLVDDGSSDRELRNLLKQLAALDRRFRIKLSERGGISRATNQALDLATGEFVAFLDHDDLLAPQALELIEKKFREGFDAVYSDQDKLEEESRQLVEPFFKPGWSPEYFRGAMYVGHLLCVRRELASEVRFDSAFDGVQDFEFMLRVSERGAKVGHVPQVLYHWRKVAGSIAQRTDAKSRIDELQQKAVAAHLARLGRAATVEPTHLPHRLKISPGQRREHPRISIIIPTRNAPEHIGRCLDSLYEKTSFPNFEVLLIDNDTTDREALAHMRRHPVRRVLFPSPFNYSRANNLGARHATGEYLVFLNNDTEIVTAEWLDALLFQAEQADVGAAGALLLFPNETVQHAGVILGMRGTADHVMRGFPANVDGYAGSLICAREVSAVTAACLMMRKELFEDIGGFNEHFFTAYQDVDLCLRLRARGLRVICTPRAVLLHHESATRKNHYDMIDRMLLLDEWRKTIESGDPYYNPHLDVERGDYSLRN